MSVPLPDGVRTGVEAALEGVAGRPVRVLSARALGGGCINPSARVETDGGEAFFVKWNERAPRGMFEAEADGLEALRTAARGGPLVVPEVLGSSDAAGSGTAWLLLELVPEGRPGAAYAEALGHGLAALHRRVDGPYGWARDNFLGSLPQANPESDGWTAFWRDARLVPQLARARASGHFRGAQGRALEEVVERLDRALEGEEDGGPSLVHGDLWGGNVYPGPDGRPVLIDPAVYRGHGEVDLAMSELFGGFPPGWLDAYAEARPLDERYERVRRPLYQIYYLLAHVNLFGASYVAGTTRAARAVLSAL